MIILASSGPLGFGKLGSTKPLRGMGSDMLGNQYLLNARDFDITRKIVFEMIKRSNLIFFPQKLYDTPGYLYSHILSYVA